MTKSYTIGPNAVRGLKKLLREDGAYSPADRGVRRTTPDVPAYCPAPTFWQVKYDATGGWLVRVAENATSVAGIHVHDEAMQGTTEWYKIANSPAGTTEGLFAVYAHIKRRVKVDGGNIGACVFVSATAVGATAPGAEPANYSAGDAYTLLIATCATTAVTGEGGTTYKHTVTRRHRDKVMMESAVPGVIEPYWAVPAVPAATFTPHTPASTTAPICGGNLADAALPAANSATVWYLVDCTGATPAPSVVTTQAAADGKIYVNVFSLLDGCLTGDTRANLANAVFYP